MGAFAVEEKGYHVAGRVAARYLLPAHRAGCDGEKIREKVNKLLKICIFAPETSDA
jgi:hypothetical protein